MSTVRVLVVDDSISDFYLIDISMEQAFGKSVVLDHAPSVDDAARMIGENEYAVILHDLYVPPCGPESVKATYKIAPDTPIIAISGQTSPDLHRTAISNGARLFCSKSDLGGGNIASILAQIVPGFAKPQGDAGD